jgi:four helix bundle protein
VALNISEGKGRFSKKEFKQFLYIARGSLYETVAMLQIFKKKNWLEQSHYGDYIPRLRKLTECYLASSGPSNK